MKSRVVALMVGACGLWVLAVTLLVVRTFAGQLPALGSWAVMVGLWACVLTGWALLLHERHRVETIASIIQAAERETVDGLRSL